MKTGSCTAALYILIHLGTGKILEDLWSWGQFLCDVLDMYIYIKVCIYIYIYIWYILTSYQVLQWSSTATTDATDEQVWKMAVALDTRPVPETCTAIVGCHLGPSTNESTWTPMDLWGKSKTLMDGCKLLRDDCNSRGEHLQILVDIGRYFHIGPPPWSLGGPSHIWCEGNSRPKRMVDFRSGKRCK